MPAHVVQRGNNRQECFATPKDFSVYLGYLGEASAKHECEIHSYVLMSNHVHLLVTSRCKAGLSSMMQSIGRRYVRWFNDSRGRSGTLWEGRFRSSLVDTERYLLECHRYIELNPVRAGVVADPATYPWSSFRHHALSEPDSLVIDHPEYLRFGSTEADRCDAYARFVRAGVSPAVLDAIRRCLNKNRALGTESFLGHLESIVGRSVRPRARGRPGRVGTDNGGSGKVV